LCPALALEAVQHFGSFTSFSARIFEGDVAAEERILRLERDRRGAAAEFSEDSLLGDHLAGHGGAMITGG